MEREIHECEVRIDATVTLPVIECFTKILEARATGEIAPDTAVRALRP